MPKKSILVVANSYKKKPGRCIAGLEVTAKNRPRVGRWCRPISQDKTEGELLPQHRKVEGGQQILPLTIVSVPLTANAENKVHPEDWFVSVDESWEIVGSADNTIIPELIETPPSLWLQPKESADKATVEFIDGLADHQSIFLIKPTNLRLRLWREYNPFEGYTQKKVRVVFDYSGTTYSLSLTDPIASDKYAKGFPSEDENPKEIALPHGDNYALCVSLTPAFKGIHYKVVATILELP